MHTFVISGSRLLSYSFGDHQSGTLDFYKGTASVIKGVYITVNCRSTVTVLGSTLPSTTHLFLSIRVATYRLVYFGANILQSQLIQTHIVSPFYQRLIFLILSMLLF